MAYSKTSWVDRSVQYPNRFTQAVNGSLVTLTPSPGTVTTAGTPITAAALNKMETQYEQVFTDLPTTAVLTPTLVNGWVQNSVAYPCKYWKDTDGVVHFRLAVSNGAMGVNNSIMTFPEGYRPGTGELFAAHVDNDNALGTGLFLITAGGLVQNIRELNTNTLVILNGSFKAVN